MRRLRIPAKGVVVAVLALFATGAFVPGAEAHDGIMTPAGHAAEDAVVLTPAQERGLDAHTRTVSAMRRGAAEALPLAPQDFGEWGPVVDWPVVGVHVALLPNGKVLAYDSIGDLATEKYVLQDHTRATIWDPATGTQTPVNVDTGYNIFCSGLAHLIDGRMFMAGGNRDQQLNGIIQTHLFDPSSNRWSLGPNMAAARWYPTVTPLNNGEMLITSGRVDTPEVRTLAGGLRALSTASLGLPLYPWMDVAPSGRAFYSGPDQTLRALDPTGTGTWQTFGQRDTINRDYGGHATFDIGKMLIAGGGPSTADSRVVNFNGTTPQISPTAPMAFGRRQHNLTVLADGTVLATGGNSSGASLVDLNAGVYPAEQWNPATGQWRTLAAMQVTRQYHSTALLLPDGRVLSAGGGICGICDDVGYLAKNAEIFSPPYLFQADGTLAPRPEIDAAPASTTYGAAMAIATGDPTSIRKVALIRLGAVTHSNNMEQRYIPLSFTVETTSITATAPANANIAPPGPYMLFIIDANGVPSIARMVSVQGDSPPAVTLTQPADGASFTPPAIVNLAATASDADGTVTKVEFFSGAAKLGEDTTAPYSFTWSSVPAGSYTLTARATDELGAITTSLASRITVGSNTPPTANITTPADGAVFAWKPTITVTATASDSDGNITKVEFRDGTTVLGQDTSAPYSFRWRNVPSGSHVLTARATDNGGAVTTSAPVGITVRPKR
jgi:Galactose oxidase-like, Early set domain/Bacterial Ig domain